MGCQCTTTNQSRSYLLLLEKERPCKKMEGTVTNWGGMIRNGWAGQNLGGPIINEGALIKIGGRIRNGGEQRKMWEHGESWGFTARDKVKRLIFSCLNFSHLCPHLDILNSVPIQHTTFPPSFKKCSLYQPLSAAHRDLAIEQ